jgi:hypothetical protein
MSFRIQADGLVLATRGGLVLAAELFRTVDVLREGLSPPTGNIKFSKSQDHHPGKTSFIQGCC